MTTKQIKLAQIVIGNNTRGSYAKDSAELMASIKEVGQLQPIGVRAKGKKFEIVFGHRRFIAVQKLGWKEINAVIFTGVNEKDAMIINLVENMQRKNVSLAETGRFMTDLVAKGATVVELSVRLGTSKSYVQTCLDTYKVVPVELQSKVVAVGHSKKVKPGEIPMSTISKITDAARVHKTPRAEVKKLIIAVSKGKVNTTKVNMVCKELARGKTVSAALASAERLQMVHFRCTLTKREFNRLKSAYPKRRMVDLFKDVITGKSDETIKIEI